jgi:hypothetical protein
MRKFLIILEPRSAALCASERLLPLAGKAMALARKEQEDGVRVGRERLPHVMQRLLSPAGLLAFPEALAAKSRHAPKTVTPNSSV